MILRLLHYHKTGNENASAIVALGAVSAMFGLGLAAKKREF